MGRLSIITAAVMISALFSGNGMAPPLADEPASAAGYRLERTPDVAPGDIIEAIAARHKGSVVLIDVWATWCSPCLDAIQEMKQYKPELEEHGVITIYVTDTSSAEDKYLSIIEEIGGIHYYLTDTQKRAMLARYGFDGIPHCMIFDKSGNLTYNAGFPGPETVKRLLEKVW